MGSLMPDTIAAKNGSPKNRVVSSGTTSALAWVCLLASVRAARWGTKFRRAIASCTDVSASGLTAVGPLTTRETVERETPAAAATCSIVGRDIWFSLRRLARGLGPFDPHAPSEHRWRAARSLWARGPSFW